VSSMERTVSQRSLAFGSGAWWVVGLDHAVGYLCIGVRRRQRRDRRLWNCASHGIVYFADCEGSDDGSPAFERCGWFTDDPGRCRLSCAVREIRPVSRPRAQLIGSAVPRLISLRRGKVSTWALWTPASCGLGIGAYWPFRCFTKPSAGGPRCCAAAWPHVETAFDGLADVCWLLLPMRLVSARRYRRSSGSLVACTGPFRDIALWVSRAT